MFEHIISRTIGEIGSPDRLLVAFMALILVCLGGLLTGPLAGNANPILWVIADKLFGGVSRKAYNPDREPGSLAFRGAIFGFLMIAFATFVGYMLFKAKLYFPMAGFTEPLLLTFVLSGGAAWAALTRLYRALAEGKSLKQGSFYPIAVSTRTDLNSTDDFGITRVGLGFMAVNFDKGVVAPLFWYLIGGLPFAFFYAGLAVARWALAKEGFSKGFGDFVSWLERIFGIIPHFIAGLILAFAALFTPKAQLSRAIFGLFQPGGAPYNEGGMVITALAWALNISLGGPVQDHEGSTLKRSWVGPKNASARVDKSQLKHAIYLSIMAYVLVLGLIVAGLLYTKTF